MSILILLSLSPGSIIISLTGMVGIHSFVIEIDLFS